MKTIFITGGASGIGLATAKHFHQQGWFVGIFDLNEQALKQTEKEIGSERACYQVCDVRSDASVKAAFETFSKHTNGKLDVLHNNAGVLFESEFEKEEWAKLELCVDVNVTGLMRVAYLAFPLLEQTENSVLVNMASISSSYGVPRLAIYSSSKAFVQSFTEALNIEWKGKGINVVSIMPPFVGTPMISDISEHFSERMAVEYKPEDIAAFIYKVAEQAHKDKAKLHNPVGKKTAIAMKAIGMLSLKAQEKAMRFLTKHD